MGEADRQRMDYMRSTAGWHVQRVGGCGERGAGLPW